MLDDFSQFSKKIEIFINPQSTRDFVAMYTVIFDMFMGVKEFKVSRFFNQSSHSVQPPIRYSKF